MRGKQPNALTTVVGLRYVEHYVDRGAARGRRADPSAYSRGARQPRDTFNMPATRSWARHMGTIKHRIAPRKAHKLIAYHPTLEAQRLGGWISCITQAKKTLNPNISK